jgi:hypothetical protein
VVNSLLARIKSNLPVENSEQLIKIIQHISVYTLQVDENMDSADDLLKKILSDRVNDKTV